MKRWLCALALALISPLSLMAVGPYTAFTYGDPAALSPTMVVGKMLLFGLPFSNSFFPVPIAPTIASGVVGTVYTETFVVAGGTSPFVWSITDPSNIPPGLSFSGGVLSGTPTTVGSYTFHVQVTDANPSSNTQPFTVIISAPSGGGNGGYVSKLEPPNFGGSTVISYFPSALVFRLRKAYHQTD